MATDLTTLLGGGSSGGSTIEQASNNQVLEANKEYWVLESADELTLPDASGLSAGAYVKLYPSSGSNFGYRLNSVGKNIFYNNALRGPATATHPRVDAITHTDPITYYWTGFAWVTLPITSTMTNLTDTSGSPIIYTSSDLFITPEANNLVVTVVGGGGSGAGQAWSGGGGGGGGAAIVKHAMSLPAGTEVTITVGAGGPSGSSNSPGNAGGDSSFGTYLIAGGGGGGVNRTTPGVGGTASGSETITTAVTGGTGGIGETAAHYGSGWNENVFGGQYTAGASVTDHLGNTYSGGGVGGGSRYNTQWGDGHGGGGGAAAGGITGYTGYGYGGRGNSNGSGVAGASGLIIVEFS